MGEASSSNSLVQKLQKKHKKWKKKKWNSPQSQNRTEVENERLRKWRKLLETVQVEDVAQIRELEASVAATRERNIMHR